MTIEVKASAFLSFRAETCRLNEPMLNLELIGPLQGTGYGPRAMVESNAKLLFFVAAD